MMSIPRATADDFLTIGPRIRVLPIIHGSGDFAIQVREELLERGLTTAWRCRCRRRSRRTSRRPSKTSRDLGRRPGRCRDRTRAPTTDEPGFSYVPIDPCQGVIAAMRTARGERIAREFIDLETPRFVPITGSFPTPMRSSGSSPGPVRGGHPAGRSRRPCPGQNADRIAWMAARLRELESRYRSILFVCSILDWPWIRDAYSADSTPPPEPEPFFAPIQTFRVDPRTLIFVLGELPYITGLYERGRRELTPDDNLSVDGVKEMVLDARERLRDEASQGRPADHAAAALGLLPIRPQPLADRPAADARPLYADRRGQADGRRRLRPGAGRDGPRVSAFAGDRPDDPDGVDFDEPGAGADGDRPGRGAGLGHGPDGQPAAGPGAVVADVRAAAQAAEQDQTRWKQRWNPFGMCSWPPEDDRIESFHRHVRDQAKAILGADLARTEKFTTSVRDGIDIRETLRNWHTGDLYVKVVPPSRGLDRGRRLPVRQSPPTPRSTPIARPGTPSTPRNRRSPSTPPTP